MGRPRSESLQRSPDSKVRPPRDVATIKQAWSGVQNVLTSDEKKRESNPSLSIVFLLSQCLGIYPWGRGDGHLVWSTILLIAHVTLLVFGVSRTIGSGGGESATFTLVNFGITLTQSVVNLVHWLGNFRRQSSLKHIIKVMMSFHCPNKWLALKTLSAFLILCFFSFVHCNVHHSIDSDSLAYWWCFCYTAYYEEFLNYLILSQFHCAIDLATFQVRRLTLKLRNEVKKSYDMPFVEDLVEQHSFFISFAQQVNEFYSQQLLLTCAYIFLKFITVVFHTTLLKWERSANRTEITISLSHALALLYSLYTTASTCERNKEEVNAFNYKLFKLSSEIPLFCKNKKIRLYVEMKPSVEFTACNFFSIGYPLVTSMLAAATTYIVIIVQFNMGGH